MKNSPLSLTQKKTQLLFAKSIYMHILKFLFQILPIYYNTSLTTFEKQNGDVFRQYKNPIKIAEVQGFPELKYEIHSIFNFLILERIACKNGTN